MRKVISGHLTRQNVRSDRRLTLQPAATSAMPAIFTGYPAAQGRTALPSRFLQIQPVTQMLGGPAQHQKPVRLSVNFSDPAPGIKVKYFL
jgi:hypothetical protein